MEIIIDHKNQNFGTSRESVIDNLLFEIYDKWAYKCRHDSSWESDTITSASDAMSSCIWRRSIETSINGSENEQKQFLNISEASLNQKPDEELKKIISSLKQAVAIFSSRLVRQLKRRDHALVNMQKNCDILTAILQASSLKRREDTKLKFVMEPKPGNEAFRQWCEAMKGVARLPLGLPTEIRKKVWLSLANNHITVQKYDWNRVIKFAFNERSNPDDDSLGLQIVKDLHRTGCDTFTTESERAILKRVLLAYARWNKRVGYCQGFNVLAAIILEVMERNEEDSLKIMVYLVDHILPESYFAQNLQALSIDMAVFRELLTIRVPKLAIHLNNLQALSQQQNSPFSNSNHYEPPLTNVFTMQWFLTLFATCLSPDLVLHIWDSIMLEGSEIIFRTGLAIWELLSDRLIKVNDADSFYCTMRDLTSQLSDGCIAKPDQLINRIYNMAPIPFPGLSNLRDKFTYNITPFSSIPTAIVSYGSTGNETGDEAEEDEDCKFKSVNIGSMGCFGSIIPSNNLLNNKSKENQISFSLSSVDISQVGPGAVSISPIFHTTSPGATQERMCTNLTTLESHYNKIKDKQRKTSLLMNNLGPQKNSSQSHILSPSRHQKSKKDKIVTQKSSQIIVNSTYPCLQNSMVNHLFLTRATANNVELRPSIIRQNRLKTSTSEINSCFNQNIKSLNIDKVETQKNLFDFDLFNNLGSYTVPESTISSIRPASDSSTSHLKRSLSQSDLTNSCNDFGTPRVRSLTDFQQKQVTLLELSKASQFIRNDIQKQDDSSKLINESILSPDLNFVLERHHKRIQNGPPYSKTLKPKETPIKILPIEDLSSPTEFGHTARWVAEHHSQLPYDVMQTPESNYFMRQSSVPFSSHKASHNALFGTKLGLYKTMAESRLYRSRMNGILHSAYLNKLHRSVNCGLVNCD